MKTLYYLFLTLILWGCSSQQLPEGAQAVSQFDKSKYLGEWYEIARLDFTFEKDLENTMANYSLNPDGSIKVLNSGYNYKKEEWTKVEGKAKFVGAEDIAQLKVSFFGPFYSPYNVIALEGDYKYALVAGKDLEYLWILSREKSIPEYVRASFLKQAKELGYATEDLIWPKHDRERPEGF